MSIKQSEFAALYKHTLVTMENILTMLAYQMNQLVANRFGKYWWAPGEVNMLGAAWNWGSGGAQAEQHINFKPHCSGHQNGGII
jgi:hypothetical protein